MRAAAVTLALVLLSGCAAMLNEEQKTAVARTVDDKGKMHFRDDRWSMCATQSSGTMLQIEIGDPVLYEDWRAFCEGYWNE
jgi:uncharacterized protein YceK